MTKRYNTSLGKRDGERGVALRACLPFLALLGVLCFACRVQSASSLEKACSLLANCIYEDNALFFFRDTPTLYTRPDIYRLAWMLELRQSLGAENLEPDRQNFIKTLLAKHADVFNVGMYSGLLGLQLSGMLHELGYDKGQMRLWAKSRLAALQASGGYLATVSRESLDFTTLALVLDVMQSFSFENEILAIKDLLAFELKKIANDTKKLGSMASDGGFLQLLLCAARSGIAIEQIDVATLSQSIQLLESKFSELLASYANELLTDGDIGLAVGTVLEYKEVLDWFKVETRVPVPILAAAETYLHENFMNDPHRAANCAKLLREQRVGSSLKRAEIARAIDAAWNYGWNNTGFSLAALYYGCKLAWEFGFTLPASKISNTLASLVNDARVTPIWVPILHDTFLNRSIPRQLADALLSSANDYLEHAVLDKQNVTKVWASMAMQSALTNKNKPYSQLKAQYKMLDPAALLYEFGPEVLLRFQELGAMLGNIPRFKPSFFADFLVAKRAYAARPGSVKADVFSTWAVLKIVDASGYSLSMEQKEDLRLGLDALAAPGGGYYFNLSNTVEEGYSKSFTLEGWYKALDCLAMLE